VVEALPPDLNQEQDHLHQVGSSVQLRHPTTI
jgi:hypothetical protein